MLQWHALTTSMTLYSLAPGAVWAATHVRPNTWEVTRPVIRTGLASGAQTACLVAVLACSLWAIASHVNSFTLEPAGVLFLLISVWVLGLASSVLASEPLFLAMLIYPAIVLAIWLMPLPSAPLSLIGSHLTTYCFASLAVAIARPDIGLVPESSANRKAILGHELLTGLASHPNTMGQLSALGAFLALRTGRSATRLLGFSVCVVCVFWSGSRTSVSALITGAIASAYVSLSSRSSIMNRLRKPLLGGSLALAGGLVLFIPLLSTSPDEFSGRGSIWAASLNRWAARPGFGFGWNAYQDAARYANEFGRGAFHGHNAAVTILMSTGAVGLAASVALFGWSGSRALIAANGGYVGYSLCLTVLFCTEMPWSIANGEPFGFCTWIPIAVISKYRRDESPLSLSLSCRTTKTPL